MIEHVPNPEIGSDIPPRAAEVEPPAFLVPVGGSADTFACTCGCENDPFVCIENDGVSTSAPSPMPANWAEVLGWCDHVERFQYERQGVGPDASPPLLSAAVRRLIAKATGGRQA